MKTWKRATAQTLCGGPCAGVILVGQPILEIRIVDLAARKVRCVLCAGEEPPPDLPAAIVQSSTFEARPMVRAGMVKLPFDHRMAAAGRDPGEDD